MQTTKTDNHNPEAKLELRRYFLRAYHADPPSVFDCCQGDGLLWRELRKEFSVASYLGVDLKDKKGRLRVDSARVLDQPGWSFNVIDVDTYGSPWSHWFALLKHAPRGGGLTVFLTVGLVTIGGMSSRPDNETMRVLDLAPLDSAIKARGVKSPPSLFGRARDRIGLFACLGAARDFGLQIAEAQEAENDRGHARYFGVRLERPRGVGGFAPS